MYYEFEDADARIMNSVGIKFQIFGILLMIIGVIRLSSSFATLTDITASSLSDGLQGLSLIAIGILLYRPSDNLRKIASTEGNDIRELMVAVSELKLTFFIISILFGVMIILTIIDFFSGGT